MSCTLCRTISCQCTDSGLAPLYFFGCRQGSRAVFQLIATFDNIRNSRNVTIHIPFGKERKHAGYLNPEQERVFTIIVSLFFGIQHSDSHQTYLGTSFIKSFYSRQFHRLCLCNLIAGTIARPHCQQRSDQSENSTDLYTGKCKLTVTFLQQEPTADTYNKHTAKHPSGQHRMEKLIDRHRRSCHRPEIYHFITHRIRIELHAYRMLHPCIRNENPPSGNGSSQACQPSRSKVKAFAYLIPSEEHDRNKRSFHKERQNTFDSKRRTENIPHKPRIITPVRTKLKLQNQPRCHTDGEVNTEKFHPKLGSPLPEFIACFIIQRLHYSHHHSQSEGERNENPVVHGCHRKLGSRPIDQRGVNTFNHNLM